MLPPEFYKKKKYFLKRNVSVSNTEKWKIFEKIINFKGKGLKHKDFARFNPISASVALIQKPVN